MRKNLSQDSEELHEILTQVFNSALYELTFIFGFIFSFVSDTFCHLFLRFKAVEIASRPSSKTETA